MTTTPAITQFRVKPTLTTKPRIRDRRTVENTDYAAFTRRILTAHGRRIAQGDIEGLTTLNELQTHLDQALTTAITGLRESGYSWTDIATRLGTTKQAAQQRWAKTIQAQRESA